MVNRLGSKIPLNIYKTVVKEMLWFDGFIISGGRSYLAEVPATLASLRN